MLRKRAILTRFQFHFYSGFQNLFPIFPCRLWFLPLIFNPLAALNFADFIRAWTFSHWQEILADYRIAHPVRILQRKKKENL